MMQERVYWHDTVTMPGGDEPLAPRLARVRAAERPV
jgi:hypothetical protein